MTPPPGPARFELRVYYEDTDLAGIVYYANYLKFIERARTEALIAAGIDQPALKARDGLVFAVRRVVADYFAPALFQDRLEVVTVLAALSGAQADLRQDVLRRGDLLFRAEVRIVALRADGRPTRIPADMRDALTRLAEQVLSR